MRRADRDTFFADVACHDLVGDVIRYDTGALIADDQPTIDVTIILDCELSPWPWR